MTQELWCPLNNNYMEYTTITFEVPKGYEKQIEDLVMEKIKGILSQIKLQPSAQAKAEFDTLVAEAYTKNKKVKKV